jgi:hypothetical protein
VAIQITTQTINPSGGPGPPDGGFTDDLPPVIHPENGPPNTPVGGVPEPPDADGRPPDFDPGTPIDPNFDSPTSLDTGPANTPVDSNPEILPETSIPTDDSEDTGGSNPGKGINKHSHDGSRSDGGRKKERAKRDGCVGGIPSDEAESPGSAGGASGQADVPGSRILWACGVFKPLM